MVNGVLSDTTDFRTAVEPAVAAGLAEMNVLMADVAYLTDSGDAGGEDLAHFAGRQTQEDVLVFLADELSVGAGGAAHLSALAGIHLNVVHNGADRNAAERQSVAWLDVSLFAGEDLITLLQTGGSDDVTLFTVNIGQKGDTGSTVGIVFDMGNSGFDALLLTLEINDAVETLMSAAAAAHGLMAHVVAAGLSGQTTDKGPFRRRPGDFRKIGNRLGTTTSRSRFKLANSHDLRSLEVFDLVICAQGYIRFLVTGLGADGLTLTHAVTGSNADNVHVEHGHIEGGFDGFLHFELVGLGVNKKCNLIGTFSKLGHLFSDTGLKKHLSKFHLISPLQQSGPPPGRWRPGGEQAACSSEFRTR